MFDIRKFGAYISKLRKDSDMTQSMLADKLNLTRQSVSSYENGESFPDISILVLIAKEFGVTIDELIKSGGPTVTEEILLKAEAKNPDIPREIFKSPDIPKEILNIAPLLKPSVLEKVAKGFKKHNIDISGLITLTEYLKDETFIELLENADFDILDKNIVEKFMPVLDDVSKNNLFEKIIDGEIDYHFLEIYLPYVDSYYIQSQLEAAVLAGTIPWDALRIAGEAQFKKWETEHKERLDAGWVGFNE
ncbi:MAG: helix-turn-helix domain-containing protein [Oscillospiraceae bacterium]|nr:helix-turn-helix domain-containing protein [Oscillospiraceae bacterium]